MNILTTLQSSGFGPVNLTGTINGTINVFGDGHATLTGTIDTSGGSGSNVFPTGITIGNTTDNTGSLIQLNSLGQATQSKAPFSIAIFGTTNNGTVDDVMTFGYNNKPDGTKFIAGEPNFGLSLEADWNNGVSHAMEFNFNFSTADWNGTNVGYNIRSIYHTINRATPHIDSVLWLRIGNTGAASFKIFKGDTGRPATEVTTDLMTINSTTNETVFGGDAGSSTNLNIKNDTGSLKFGVNGDSLITRTASATLKITNNLNIPTQLNMGVADSAAGQLRMFTSASSPYTQFSGDVGGQVFNSVLGYLWYHGFNATNGNPFGKITSARPAMTLTMVERYRNTVDYSKVWLQTMTTAGTTATTWLEFAVDDTNNTIAQWSFQFGSNSASFWQVLASDGTTARIKTDPTGIGFFNTAPVAKPTVSGAKGSNAALASLMTALAGLGLVTDSTTA